MISGAMSPRSVSNLRASSTRAMSMSIQQKLPASIAALTSAMGMIGSFLFLKSKATTTDNGSVGATSGSGSGSAIEPILPALTPLLHALGQILHDLGRRAGLHVHGEGLGD